MKLVVERATLLKALGHVQSVVERRNTIPILSNVLLSADGQSMKLMATDLDLQIVEEAAATVETPGATTVSAHTLFDIVRKIPDGAQVTLDATGAKMAVTAGRARFQLQTLPREDFPVIGESDLPVQFALAAEVLVSLVDHTRFAISTEETRYYLNGIFLHAPANAGTLRAVATDGHRLARVEVPLPEGAAGMPDVIVPRKCVAELRKQKKPRGRAKAMPHQLRVSKGKQEGLTLPLGDGIKIGRAADCQLVLDDDYVSTRHAQIVRTDDGYMVEDLGSTNGTYVNNERVTSATPFTTADTLRIGRTLMVVES